VNEGRKSTGYKTEGIGWYKCVICLLLILVPARESTALYFFNVVNWDASGVGIFTFKERRFLQYNKKMELTYVAVVVLASMMFVLSGMVGYLYWQQTRMLQHLQSLAVVISTQFVQHTPEPLPEPEAEVQAEEPAKEEEPVEEEKEEDDRLPVVEEKADVVEGPPELDLDTLEGKTATQLKEILTQKGIPFGKRDSKPVLIQLIKATA